MIALGVKKLCGQCGAVLYAESDIKQIACPTCGKVLHVEVGALIYPDQADELDPASKVRKLAAVPDNVDS